MAVYLTPNEVATLTGVTVTDAIISTADQMCKDETGYTFSEHNSARAIPEAMVKQAWSLVSVNVSRWFTAAGDDPAVSSENQGDYSYSVDVARRTRAENDSPLSLQARRLLDLRVASWGRMTDRGFTTTSLRY